MFLGKRISGRYKILEMIGGGGMSNVYLAHDMILDRDVAIKVLRYDFSNEDDLHRRFQREALSATSLTHPNIVNIFDVGEDGDIHYLVMEYVKGKTLKQYIVGSAPLHPHEAVEIMKQLTSAIANAHQNQIIHRDIKPQNILMDDDQHVKVTDFGIAMALSATSFTQTNSVLGTVHYLSPEQARGGTATKKSDIYALGIVLYELLTGELPFSGESAVSIALKHLQTETPSVRNVQPTIPQSLENVVMKATAKDPQHRYRTVEEMQYDLESVLSPERMKEKSFVTPYDDGATKAMPALKVPHSGASDDLQATKMIPKTDESGSVEPGSKKKNKKVWPWVLGVIGFLLLMSLIIIIALPNLFGPKRVEIPDVSNLSLEEAIETLTDAGFEISNETEEVSEEVEQGHVIRTIPQEGKIRDEGSSIEVFVSLGKELSVFPKYEGSNIDQVRGLLENRFKSLETTEEFSDEPAGTILSQTPAAGTEILPEETDIVFTVSKGQDLRTVIDLVGYNDKALNDYASASGFNIRIVQEDFSDTVPIGNVISQKPVDGTKLAPGSNIEVVTSKGPIERPIKTYIEIIEIPYEPNEDGTEQIVKVYIQDQDQTMAKSSEEFVLTETRTVKIQLDIEEDQMAAYRIDLNGTEFAQETIDYDDL